MFVIRDHLAFCVLDVVFIAVLSFIHLLGRTRPGAFDGEALLPLGRRPPSLENALKPSVGHGFYVYLAARSNERFVKQLLLDTWHLESAIRQKCKAAYTSVCRVVYRLPGRPSVRPPIRVSSLICAAPAFRTTRSHIQFIRV